MQNGNAGSPTQVAAHRWASGREGDRMRAWETSWQVQNSPRPAPAPTNPPVRCPGPAVPPLFHGFFSAVGARLETTHPAGCPTLNTTPVLLLLLPRPPGAAGGVGAAAMANPLVQRCGARPRAPPAPHLPFPSGPGQAPDRPKPHLPAPGRPAGPPAAAEGARPREARPAPALRPSGRPPPAQQPPPGRTPGPGPPARAGSAPPRLAEASSSARLGLAAVPGSSSRAGRRAPPSRLLPGCENAPANRARSLRWRTRTSSPPLEQTPG